MERHSFRIVSDDSPETNYAETVHFHKISIPVNQKKLRGFFAVIRAEKAKELSVKGFISICEQIFRKLRI